ncbi:MAG: hypothetical protein GEV03_23745 [Streptosporangiales bacterium]|nr:hypothetical protein [Streptosporangiales bacterium]
MVSDTGRSLIRSGQVRPLIAAAAGREGCSMTSSPQPASDELAGHGEAANGLVSVTVGSDGRLRTLHLDPQVMRMGQRGPVMDSHTLAAEITTAVNAAIDDLQSKVREGTGDIAGRLEADLDQVTGNFERALEQIDTDIARAHRRLQS